MIGFSIPELEETTAKFRALSQEIDRTTQSFRLGVPRLIPAALPVASGSELPPAEEFGEPIAEPRGLLEFPSLLPDLTAVINSLGAISAEIDQATRKLGEGVGALTSALDRFNAKEMRIVVEGVSTPSAGGSLLNPLPAIPGAEGRPSNEPVLDAIGALAKLTGVVAVFTGNPFIVLGAELAGVAADLAKGALPHNGDAQVAQNLQRISQFSKEDLGNATAPQREEMIKIMSEELAKIEAEVKRVEFETKVEEPINRVARAPNYKRQAEALARLDTLRLAYRRALAYVLEAIGDDLPSELRELVPTSSQPALRMEQSAIPQPAPKEFKASIELVMHSSEKIDVRRIVSDPDFTLDFYSGLNRAGTGFL